MLQRNSLRGRIALTTTCAILAVVGILLVFSEGRASLQNKRFIQNQLASSQELWSTVINLDSAILQRVASDLARLMDLDTAGEGIDTGSVAKITELVDAAVLATAANISISIVAPDGTHLASVGEDWTGGRNEAETLLAGISKSGLRRTKRNHIRLFVSEPVRRGTQVMGHVVASVDLVERTGRFFSSSWAIGINLPGVSPVLTRPLHEKTIPLPDYCCDGDARFRTIDLEGLKLNVFSLELLTPEGETLGHFLSLSDITEAVKQRLLIGLTAASAATLAVLLGLGALMWVLRIAFRP